MQIPGGKALQVEVTTYAKATTWDLPSIVKKRHAGQWVGTEGDHIGPLSIFSLLTLSHKVTVQSGFCQGRPHADNHAKQGKAREVPNAKFAFLFTIFIPAHHHHHAPIIYPAD